MGANYQVFRAAANAIKGFRQLQKAHKAIYNDKREAAASHYDKAQRFMGIAIEHLGKAENDSYDR